MHFSSSLRPIPSSSSLFEVLCNTESGTTEEELSNTTTTSSSGQPPNQPSLSSTSNHTTSNNNTNNTTHAINMSCFDTTSPKNNNNNDNNNIATTTPTTSKSSYNDAFINAIESVLSTKRRDLCRKNNGSSSSSIDDDLTIVKEYMFNTTRLLPKWGVDEYLLPLLKEEENSNNNNNNNNIETSFSSSSATTIITSNMMKQRIRYRSEQFQSITKLTISQYRLATVLITHLADYCARTSNVYPVYMAWEKILESGMTPTSRTLSTFLYVLGLPTAATTTTTTTNEEEEEIDATTTGRRRRDVIATEVAMYHDALYSPTEKTIAILVKSLVARGDAKGAEALLDGIPPSSAIDDGGGAAQQLLLRHRTTSPILKLYCDKGDIDSAIRLYRRMRNTSRVKMDTSTYVDFIAAVARNGYFHSDSKGILLPPQKRLSKPPSLLIEGGGGGGGGAVVVVAEEQQETLTPTIMRGGPELLNLLISEMAEDVLDISEELAGVLREGFMAGFEKCCDVTLSSSKVNAGTMLLDSGEFATNMMMTTTTSSLTTRYHDNQSLIANRVVIDKSTALCSATGVKLRFMILDTTQRIHVHDTLLDMAREKSMEYTSRLAAKGRSTTDNVKAAETASQILREFSEWLDTRAGPPYTAIVDGANVAYFGWGRVNVYQLIHMVNDLERRGEYPLVIFPQKYTNQRFHLRRGMMQVLRDEEMEALEGLKAKGQMYVVPPMCLDDLYWMLASVSKQTFSTGGRNIDVLPDESNNNSSPNHGRYPGLRPMVISNDKMRDHRLELPLEERAFRRWCTSHIVNYNFTEYVEDSTEERTITFSAAGLFSDEIQGNLCPEVVQGASKEESDGNAIMAWHFPVSEWDDNERFCLRLPLTTTTATGLYTPPIHSESFLQHLENVKSSWLPDYSAANDDNTGEVPCLGEPTIDPSRMVQNVIVDGESNWI